MTSLKLTDTIAHRIKINTKCMAYVDGLLLINDYNFEIGFYTISDNPILNDIALEKIEVFFDLLMLNSIIVSKEKYDLDKFSGFSNNNIIMVPDAVNDQCLGSLIFSKLKAIVEDDLDVGYIEISSELGKNICYTIGDDSPELVVLLPDQKKWWDDEKISMEPWWNRSDTATIDKVLEDGIYTGEFDWKDLFVEELKKAEELTKSLEKSSANKKSFKIINGGKDAN